MSIRETRASNTKLVVPQGDPDDPVLANAAVGTLITDASGVLRVKGSAGFVEQGGGEVAIEDVTGLSAALTAKADAGALSTHASDSTIHHTLTELGGIYVPKDPSALTELTEADLGDTKILYVVDAGVLKRTTARAVREARTIYARPSSPSSYDDEFRQASSGALASPDLSTRGWTVTHFNQTSSTGRIGEVDPSIVNNGGPTPLTGYRSSWINGRLYIQVRADTPIFIFKQWTGQMNFMLLSSATSFGRKTEVGNGFSGPFVADGNIPGRTGGSRLLANYTVAGAPGSYVTANNHRIASLTDLTWTTEAVPINAQYVAARAAGLRIIADAGNTLTRVGRASWSSKDIDDFVYNEGSGGLSLATSGITSWFTSNQYIGFFIAPGNASSDSYMYWRLNYFRVAPSSAQALDLGA